MPIIEVPGMGEVEFPDDMDDEAIVAAIQANIGQKGPSSRARAKTARAPVGELQKWKRAAGLAARDLSSGTLFLPQMATNAVAAVGNSALGALGSDARLPYGTGEELANLLDLPTAITDDEKLSGKFGRLIGGIWGGGSLLKAGAAQLPKTGAPMTSAGTQAQLRKLMETLSGKGAEKYATAVGTTSIGAGEVARRKGASENEQLAVELATSMLAPGQGAMASMAARKGPWRKAGAALESTGVGSIAGGLARSARKATEQIQEGTNRTIAAGRAIQDRAADPDAALAALDAAQDIIPGSRQTMAEASRDVGLNRFMHTIESGFDDKSLIAQRRLDNDKARQALLDRIGARDGMGDNIAALRDRVTTKLRDNAFQSATGPADVDPVIMFAEQIRTTPIGTKQSVSTSLDYVQTRLQALKDDFPQGIPPQHLYAVRQDLNDVLQGKMQGLKSLKGEIVGADNFRAARSQMYAIRKAIDDQIESAAPGYRKYMERYAKMSNASDAANLLNELKKGAQSTVANDFREPGAVRPLLTPSALPRQARKREGELDLRLPDFQRRQLELLEEDIMRSQGMNSAAVKGLGTDTAHKIDDTIKSTKTLADVAGIGPIAAGPARMLTWLSDKRRSQYEAALAEAAIDPKKAAAAIRAARARDAADAKAATQGKQSRRNALNQAIQQTQSARARKGT